MNEERRASFAAAPTSGRSARTFVAETLGLWHHDELVDDAVTCVSELAANAILHTRGPFDVVVRLTAHGVRLAVRDERGTHMPVVAPAPPVAAEMTALRTTGRGLAVVASLATRWGIDTDGVSKSIWVEIEADTDPAPSVPEVRASVAFQPLPAETFSVRLLGLPVRRAVASGVQVDDLLREVQLGLFDSAVAEDERERFYLLLDQSAPARLVGRYGALAAAGRGQAQFDLDISIDQPMIDAVLALRQLLEEVPARYVATAAAPSEDVTEFRSWLEREIAAQIDGAAPTPCSLV